MQAGWRLVGMSAARSTNLDGLHQATDGGIVMKERTKPHPNLLNWRDLRWKNAEFRQICF